ncbi:hypothetical protein Glove_319g31 [Diversispora epigaea]|uniref:Multifunctional tryptophan biosynthesis protein n=1 Tax=Diversispora epigaea TaxID=1348612 RepID=A0A397HVB3_9GLOM|nr:hypothetical protein Glove_319g31 [Diversispora epigaea]
MSKTTSNITVLIDNYDSFTWNVYQYLSDLDAEVQVYRNDQTTIDELISLNPKNIIISPGPGHPSTDAGISREVIQLYAGKIPILGICLGEQCIFEVFGGKVSYAGEIVHGKTSIIKHDGKGIYSNVPKDILATRYHSLAAQPDSVPDQLEVTSWSESGVLMGIRHREFTIEGVQFHPESILSEHGKLILENFLKLEGGKWEDNKKFSIKPPLAKTQVSTNSVPSILERIKNQRLTDIKNAKNQPGSSPLDYKKLLSLHVAPPLIDFVIRIKQTLPKYPAIFAEVKRASPSKGNIDITVNAAEQALTYAKAGASVISVLTEPKWFKGTLNDMRQIRDVLSTIPNRPAILRKDFILDTYQIMEARIYGADSILLIVSILSDEKLSELYNFSKHLGMEPLVEVNNEEEMKRAVKLGAKVIGVNNRNLHTFDVDLNTTSRLAEMVPDDVILAALSGITERGDVVKYLEQGVGALLIGEALMRSENKKAFIQEILGLDKSVKNKLSTKTVVKPLVKICGVSTIDAAVEAADAGADFIGLIFAKSKRQITIDRALEIISVIRDFQSEKINEMKEVHKINGKEDSLPAYFEQQYDWFNLQSSRINKNTRKPLIVGVFQNQPLDEIIKIVDHLKLDLIQLHGEESLEMSRFIPLPVIKAFHIDDNFSNPTLISQPGYNVLSLLDTKVMISKDSQKQHQGGAGITFDWKIALDIKKSASKNVGEFEFPIILAGGLTPENVVEAIELVKPWCVDVSSGVEKNGEKDPDKIREFIKNAKSIVYEEVVEEKIEDEQETMDEEKN